MRRVQLEYSLLVPGMFTGSRMPIMSSSCTVTSADALRPRYRCTASASSAEYGGGAGAWSEVSTL